MVSCDEGDRERVSPALCGGERCAELLVTPPVPAVRHVSRARLGQRLVVGAHPTLEPRMTLAFVVHPGSSEQAVGICHFQRRHQGLQEGG